MLSILVVNISLKVKILNQFFTVFLFNETIKSCIFIVIINRIRRKMHSELTYPHFLIPSVLGFKIYQEQISQILGKS